jgi:hypothetical protein
MLIIPFRRASVIWTLVAGEEGTTGVREAVVTTQLLQEGVLTLDSCTQTWAQDPYDAQYRALARVDSGVLRYLSDDARFDSQFPSHPLSRVRNRLRAILDELEVDESVLGA